MYSRMLLPFDAMRHDGERLLRDAADEARAGCSWAAMPSTSGGTPRCRCCWCAVPTPNADQGQAGNVRISISRWSALIGLLATRR
jgi:hypothetical protein